MRWPLLLLLASQSTAAQQMYRWESKDGEVHYTDDRLTIPKGVKAVVTSGAELGELKTGSAPSPVAPVPMAAASGSVAQALFAKLTQAESQAQAGHSPQAFQLLDEAEELCSTLSDRKALCSAYGRIALERLGSGQMGDAERFLRKGRAIDPDVAQLRLASGELAYAQGDLARALTEWEQGLRQSPDDYLLKKRLADVRRKSDAFGGLGLSTSKWVTVTFSGAQDAELAVFAVKTIEDARQSINELYGYTGEQRVEVVLYPLKSFESDGPGHPTWAAGLYDGRIHLATGGIAVQHGRLGATLLHEYGHRVLARTAGLRPAPTFKSAGKNGLQIDPTQMVGWPAWLDEGMAQLAPAAALAPPIPCVHGHVAPLRSLDGSFCHLKANVLLKYFEAQHAVEVMRARYGGSSVPKLLKAMEEGAPFETAFARATGTRYAEFAAAFDAASGAH